MPCYKSAGATGMGEEVIRTCGSFYLVERMRSGMTPQEACEAACQRIIHVNGGVESTKSNVKFVAINKSGEVGVSQILGSDDWKPQAATWSAKDGFKVHTGSYLINT